MRGPIDGPSSAAALVRESLVLNQDVGSAGGIASSLDGFAVQAHAQGDDLAATRLCAAAAALRATIGASVLPALRDLTDHLVTELREVLGAEGFATVWAEGQAMTQEQAVTLALQAAVPGSAP